jgi:hypothetical protein
MSQNEQLPYGGGMEKVRDCRDCKNYSRNWGVNYCDIPIPPCFDRDTSMCHNRDFVHGLVVFAESACPCFSVGKHPTRERWQRLNPEIAAEAAKRVKTIVEKAESLTVTTL